MDKINVNLYGGKGFFSNRETPLEADIIWCDHQNECSLYKKGKCLRCREAFRANVCNYGRTENIKGYTSHAQKYFGFKQTYVSDPVYNKLEYPSADSFASVGDYYWFQLTYASLYQDKDDKQWHIASGASARNCFFIPKEDLSIYLLDKLLSEKPRALMGGIISDYQSKCVPNVVIAIRKYAPELYKQLCEKDERYAKMVPNYIGKWAYIKTLKVGSVIPDCHGNKYTIIEEDGQIKLEGTMTTAAPFWGKEAYVKIIPTDDQKVKVENNDWCDANTLFSF